MYYQIEKILGSGLTGRVYKALRRDDQGWTEQPVALKIINSKNDVQYLKTEFDALVGFRSPHCVQLLAWENLKQGPALVLEYIDGVNLKQLLCQPGLTQAVIEEIIKQCRQGLLDLKNRGSFHGDLNLTNIMVDRKGQVKLIDFGFQGVKGQTCFTAQFASEDRKQGAAPSFDEDQKALKKIEQFLLQTTKPARSSHAPFSKSLCQKRTLAQVVEQALVNLDSQTRCQEPLAKKVAPFKKTIAVVVFFCTLLSTAFPWSAPQFAQLSVRSQHWSMISINGLPPRSAPIFKKVLRPGRYQVKVQHPRGDLWSPLLLKPGESFLLQPDSEDL